MKAWMIYAALEFMLGALLLLLKLFTAESIETQLANSAFGVILIIFGFSIIYKNIRKDKLARENQA